MRTYLFIFLFIVAYPPLCQARLGENEEQTAARYGQPVTTAAGLIAQHIKRVYHFSGFTISVHFFDGKSNGERFAKTDGGAVSDPELAGLLTANQFNGKWKFIGGSSQIGLKEWKLEIGVPKPPVKTGDGVLDILNEARNDFNGGAARATYDFNERALRIVVPSFQKWYSDAAKKALNDNVKGF